MSPPLSRMERGDPPPRRKSCQACVKAKRRCDQRSPACLRCVQRKIMCQYPARPSENIRSNPGQPPLSAGVLTTPSDIQLESGSQDETLLNPMEMAQDLQFFGSPWPGGEAHDLHFDGMALGAVDGPLLTSNSALCGQDNIHPGINEQNESELRFEFTGMGTSSATTELATRPPLAVSAPNRVDVAALTRELEGNLSYAIDQIKAAPRTMLMETETPWCHPLLYKERMPRVMQDAVSSCALYIAKNSVNAPMIMSCIDARVNDLLDSTLPEDPLETLARTHALLLYQIIRFFDGDILARSSADATFSELESSVDSLTQHITWTGESNPGTSGNDFDLPTYPLQPSREYWKEWVLQESARRTFLVASFFLRTWKLLTGRPLPCCRRDIPLYMHQSWTLSAHLWQARNAYEFSLAWKERKHYVVTRKAVISTLADAGRDDIESFGKMLLTTAMGIDEARAWLGMKGVAL
ncbi:Regulator of drug sensitivity 1 [Cytospora mali]|uniref:Regulator of drug sensitivity 1 n=1 Tax=Cytospora mali TaxID=578113 RepID=A0A194V408_CYTMA|nr:Regulator of drug sensitivity 1 [Valsa mali var. pyri (nom. inval.)]